MWPVIPHRPVLRAAIIPEGDRIFGPAKPALKKWVLGVLIEIGQNGIALIARNSDNVVCESTIDVQRLLSRYRMRSYNRVFSPRIGWLVGNACVCVKAAIDRLSIMHGGKQVQIVFHPVGQYVVSRVHAGEQGIAAVRRTLLDVEDASHRPVAAASTGAR